MLVGDRVRIRSLGIKGTIEYIDYRHAHQDFMHPFQVRLDRPWGEEPPLGIYRTSLTDLVKLKKKKKKRKTRMDEIKDFMEWLESSY